MRATLAAHVALLASGALIGACGAHKPLAPAAEPGAAPRVVAQIPVNAGEFTVQTPDGRYAVFGRVAVDLTAKKVAWADVEGVLGVPAQRGNVYLQTAAGVVSLDLRTGQRTTVAPERAEKVLADAPAQAWVSSGMVRNDALVQLTPATRAVAESLAHVEAAAVISVDEGARRVLTAASGGVCLWDMRALARHSCAPNAHASYELVAGKLVVSARADGAERFAVLSRLDEAPVWQPDLPDVLRQRSLQQPCDLSVVSDAGANAFERDGTRLFSLFDFGPDGWAIVLPDGHYKASAAVPVGLAFFAPDGQSYPEERVRAWNAADHVERNVGRGAHGKDGCVL